MSWMSVLKKVKGWFPAGTLNKEQLKAVKTRFRLEFLNRLKGNDEEEALFYLDLLEAAIDKFGTEEGERSFMTPEYVVFKLNEILERAGIDPEKESLKDME